ncbi:MAG: hypothetical protein V2G33_03160 [bacterium JZ-2024 1]
MKPRACLFLLLFVVFWYFDPQQFPYFAQANPSALPEESRQTLRQLLHFYFGYQFYSFVQQAPPETLDTLRTSPTFPHPGSNLVNPFQKREIMLLLNSQLSESEHSLGDISLLNFAPLSKEPGIWFQTIIRENGSLKSVFFFLPESVSNGLTLRIQPKMMNEKLGKVLSLPPLEQALYWQCEMLEFLFPYWKEEKNLPWWIRDFPLKPKREKKKRKGTKWEGILFSSGGVECYSRTGDIIFPLGGKSDERADTEVSAASEGTDTKGTPLLP